MKLGKHFDLDEFLVSETAERAGIDMTPPSGIITHLSRLVGNVLDPLRDALGRPIIITSGFRPLEVNRLVGSSDTSQHVQGEAADLIVPGMTPRRVCEAIIELKLPFDQLILEFDKWTHVSYDAHRQRSEVLTARKLQGHTRYLRGLA